MLEGNTDSRNSNTMDEINFVKVTNKKSKMVSQVISKDNKVPMELSVSKVAIIIKKTRVPP